MEGEELTVSNVPARDTLPVHERRSKYFEGKGFICHCCRCDASGDDTRQFDCFDSACKGVIMVCHPISGETSLASCWWWGDDVPYVTPHLLPCTICHRTAPAAYQTKMFALEARLPDLNTRLMTSLVSRENRGNVDYGQFTALLNEVANLQLPRRHQMVYTIMRIHSNLFFLSSVVQPLQHAQEGHVAVQRAAVEYIAAQESITPGNQLALLNVIHSACLVCIVEWQKHEEEFGGSFYIFPPQQTKEMLQRFVRMRVPLRAVNSRESLLDSALAAVLAKMPALQSTEVCVFCEESPLRAAITLLRCGKCKKVCYCSVGCQKDHWKLHKKICK